MSQVRYGQFCGYFDVSLCGIWMRASAEARCTDSPASFWLQCSALAFHAPCTESKISSDSESVVHRPTLLSRILHDDQGLEFARQKLQVTPPPPTLQMHAAKTSARR